ncbi:hypothetical protein EDC14_1003107 [Hydrogenispora ethanolica]|uniref:Uncharacterized protein n=1 Tax=Hydrogenispora ethanolica TaxID=1082276 RepID=A0A4R1S745_HYDET|nr:hypothetical protein EDC14_1003107 [Hydrogenispora ethanolica]
MKALSIANHSFKAEEAFIGLQKREGDPPG